MLAVSVPGRERPGQAGLHHGAGAVLFLVCKMGMRYPPPLQGRWAEEMGECAQRRRARSGLPVEAHKWWLRS